MRGCATALTMATVLVSAQVRAYHVDGVDGEVYYGPVWKDVGHPSINNLLESGEYAALGKSARRPQYNLQTTIDLTQSARMTVSFLVLSAATQAALSGWTGVATITN